MLSMLKRSAEDIQWWKSKPESIGHGIAVGIRPGAGELATAFVVPIRREMKSYIP